MSTPVLLNNLVHADLRVALEHGGDHGDSVNVTRVWPTEFEALQREYVILFRRGADGKFFSIALLGVAKDENLYLQGSRWEARYVPAAHARGPFSIGVDDRELTDPKVHLDLADPRIREGGEPLFLDHGGSAPLLTRVTAALQVIHEGENLSAAMFDVFLSFQMLAPVTLQLTLQEGARFDIEDCFTIDSDQMRHLNSEAVDALYQSGFLQPAIWAMSSLGNVPYLIDRKLARDGLD